MSFGWQEWSVLTPDIFGPAGVNKIDPKLAPIESSLSWLGMPGITAYFGLLEVGRPRPGETVVVSAASGAVGQLVGEIAKLAGCRAVAIAGDDNKLQWCREIGFDAAINYKKATDLTAAVKEACAEGVDVFFDNTAGPIHDAVMKNLSTGARVVICGRVALAGQFGKPDIGERFMGHLIVTRLLDAARSHQHAWRIVAPRWGGIQQELHRHYSAVSCQAITVASFKMWVRRSPATLRTSPHRRDLPVCNCSSEGLLIRLASRRSNI
jgi:NADPH:quinone reductase-like Zn-dependent oxidoreductase